MRDLLEALKVLDKYGLLARPAGKPNKLTASEVAEVLSKPCEKSKNGWTDQDEHNLREWYEGGYSTKEIAKDLGRSVFAVRARLSQLGIKRKR